MRRGAEKAFANARSLGGVPLQFAWIPKPAQPVAAPAGAALAGAAPAAASTAPPEEQAAAAVKVLVSE